MRPSRVGKLKTRCVASRVDLTSAVERVSNKGTHGDEWVVTLQTPALLCEIGAVGLGLNDAFGVYGEYWTEVSGGRLEMKALYATQELAGGGYLWRQFSPRPGYAPYVLTQTGSTFS